MPLWAQSGLGQMLPCMPFKLPCPSVAQVSPVAVSSPSRLKAMHSCFSWALHKVKGLRNDLGRYPVLITCAKPCIMPGVPVPLSNSPQSPIWAYTGPEKRSLVWSRPEGSFCVSVSPRAWHNAWDTMSTQYVHVHEWLNRLINYLEGRMKQKSGSLWFFTVNQRKLRLLWIYNPWILVFFSHLLICYVCFLFTHWLPEAHHSESNEECTQMTKIKGEDMNVGISISCCPCSGWKQQHCSSVVIFAEIILRLADWSVVKQRGSVDWPLSSRTWAHLLRL